MAIADLEYAFKSKINKVDSAQNKNFLIPEIDLALNEGMELFIKMIAQPRLKKDYGFEKNQRSIDDIRTIVMDSVSCPLVQGSSDNYALPADYWFFVKGYVEMSKGACTDEIGRLYIRQHDDEFEESPFDRSSFEWREVNGVFTSNGIKLYASGFSVTDLLLTYIRRPLYMHNAAGFDAVTGYKSPSGVAYTGTQDCELPVGTHSEIVDLAVLIAIGKINSPEYQLKLNQLNLNNLK